MRNAGIDPPLSEESLALNIADYIARMTDQYAVNNLKKFLFPMVSVFKQPHHDKNFS